MRATGVAASSLLVALLCTGCPRLYEEYPPLTAQLLVLGIDNKIRGDDFSWDPAYEDAFVSVSLYLSEAANIDQVGQTPVDDLVVTLFGSNMGRVELLGRGEGLYSLDSNDSTDLRYGPKLDYEMSTIYGGKDRAARVWLPDAPWAGLPDTHPSGTAMNLSLDPDNFDATVDLVFDTSGSIVHSTEPASLGELLDLSEGDVFVGSTEIPGSAFGSPGSLRGVGVAGLRVDRGAENFVNMEASGCRMVAGMMELHEVEIL